MQDFLQLFADWLTYQILGLVQGTPLASSVNFFIYDTIKVTLLLAVIVFWVAIVRSFITPQKVKKWVAGRTEGVGNVLAALLGIPTPFCSCSAVPLFIGFVESGVPLGITFSFLIASPLINEVAAAMLLAMFGWQIALIYIVSGLIIAIVAGIIIGRLHLESEVEDFVWKCKMHDQAEKPMTWRDRIDFGISESKSITLTVLPYIIIGIAIGAVIHGYAPADFLVGIAGPGQSACRPDSGADRHPALLERSGHDPDHGGAHGKGDGNGYRPRIHDVGHRALPAGDGHPPESDQDQTARNLCRNPLRLVHADGIFV